MRAKKVDLNQGVIIQALRTAGASVLVIGQPVDLLVGHAGKTILMEIKNPQTSYGKKGANPYQRTFMDSWAGGPVALIDTPQAALRALGVLN
tara:strand:+ start:140 stop:415 length:276 start_codon:yes stop_codon:yes gene_type:complete